MSDDVLMRDLQRDQIKASILKSNNLQQFLDEESMIKLLYGNYARLQRTYDTIKQHPLIYHQRECLLPFVKRGSDIFRKAVYAKSTTANENDPIDKTNFVYFSDEVADRVFPYNGPFISGKYYHTYVEPNEVPREIYNKIYGHPKFTFKAYSRAGREHANDERVCWAIYIVPQGYPGSTLLCYIYENDIQINPFP